MQLLDKFLPNFDFHEVHTITVQSPPERVFCAIKEITPGEMPLVRALFAIRNLPALLLRCGGLPFAGEQPLLAQALHGGFVLLAEETNRELVLGTIGQFWRISGSMVKVPDAPAFLAFDRPSYAKAAMNFHLSEQPGDSSTVVRTETRIYIATPVARRKFAIYWLLVQWGSRLIRRLWLRALKQRAESKR